MTFLHVAFLGGALAIAVPIVLHLIMRQQPKHLEFPALRFIKERQHANRRNVQLRHWLLLALRCALLGLLALALARPSIVSSGVLDQEAPVAAALVFDTHPRMQYRQQNQTRLEAAQAMGDWLLTQLPPESEVAVVDARTASSAFAVDLGAARQRIERLHADAMTRPLAEAIESALALVVEADKPRKELYVFTDLSRAAWSPEAMRAVERQMAKSPEVGVYLIDVGAPEPVNSGLGELRLSGQVLSKNSPLAVVCDLAHAGPDEQREVELYVLDRQSGEASLRSRESFDFRSAEQGRTDFRLRGLSPGVHQGFLKLAGEDSLAADDTKWFTVDVRPAWRVLIVAPQDAQGRPGDYALFLSEALAPHAIRIKGEAAFECDVIAEAELAQKPLEAYAAVCLLDPTPLAPAMWQKLQAYAAHGGGVGIFLGRNASPVDTFNEPLAQELLPGKLVRQWRTGEAYLAPEDFQHPLLAKFRPLAGVVPWESFPVFRHWQLDALAEGAAVVLRYSNGQPALIERPVGEGRVLTLTTSISDPANRRDTWNLLPTGEEPWPFVMLANEMLNYLVGSGQERLNYTAGETAIVALDNDQSHAIYSLTTPRGDQIRTPVDEKQNALVVTSTEAPGNYRIQAGGPEQGVDLGFSVNLPPETSQLQRATSDELKAVFGPTAFRVARGRDEIDRSISAGRVGQELYPYLIVLLVVVLALEQVISNRFYQDYDTSAPRSRAAQMASRAGAPQHEPPEVPVRAS
ncbi:MAG: BatA domain-containing protein [Pirellulales bacterium]